METSELKLRLIEAAARAPNAHAKGYAAGVLADAEAWLAWVLDIGPNKGAEVPKTGTLHVPKK